MRWKLIHSNNSNNPHNAWSWWDEGNKNQNCVSATDSAHAPTHPHKHQAERRKFRNLILVKCYFESAQWQATQHSACECARVCVCVCQCVRTRSLIASSVCSIWFILSFWQLSTWLKILSPSPEKFLDHFDGEIFEKKNNLSKYETAASGCKITPKIHLCLSFIRIGQRRGEEKETQTHTHKTRNERLFGFRRWQPPPENVWCGVKIAGCDN